MLMFNNGYEMQQMGESSRGSALEQAMGRRLTLGDANNVRTNMEILGLNTAQVGELRQQLERTAIGYDKDGVLENISNSDKQKALAWYNLVASMQTDSGHQIIQQIVTNNPRILPEKMIGKMQQAGYSINPENMATCGWATVNAMREKLDEQGLPRKVRVFGTPELAQMAVQAGLEISKDAYGCIIGEVMPPHTFDAKTMQQIMVESMACPVVMITNPDKQMPYTVVEENGNKYQTIVETVGKTALPIVQQLNPDMDVIGKPNPIFLEQNINAGLENFGRSRESIDRYVFIGDTPQTDVRFANDANIPGIATESVLILTGNTKSHQVPYLQGSEMPNHVIRNFADMAHTVFGISRNKQRDSISQESRDSRLQQLAERQQARSERSIGSDKSNKSNDGKGGCCLIL
jgi:ribonucleotide monophosphatase NagD (HAD superfamily)